MSEHRTESRLKKLTNMKMKLRSLFGWVTIACILLAIFRRLILLAIADGSEDWWHCVCDPWYADLYLLGLDGYWIFNGSVDDLTGYKSDYCGLHALTVVISTVVWAFVHVAATVFACIGIYNLFFKPTESNSEADNT